MKVLVLATDYPDNNGKVQLMYIHSRNLYYAKHGISVSVLNFSAKESYYFQGIFVITEHDYAKSTLMYDVLVCHAANIRNHYRFLKKYGKRFPKFVFFFHGHEVLRINETYSTPYPYMKSNKIIRSTLQEWYDTYKLSIWKRYYPSVRDKSVLVFVSKWMKDKFEQYVGIDLSKFDTHIIPNSVGGVFQTLDYNTNCKKEYDFVTIRSNLDGSKYCIDVVNRLAKENLDLSFLVIGKGKYFDFYEKSENIELREQTLVHDEIPAVLDSAKCALMPTRLDAQGVMMCEMATYGIPVVTSNIDICQELSQIFNNMILINNDEHVDLKQVLSKTVGMCDLPKSKRFLFRNTVGKEVEIICGGEK